MNRPASAAPSRCGAPRLETTNSIIPIKTHPKLPALSRIQYVASTPNQVIGVTAQVDALRHVLSVVVWPQGLVRVAPTFARRVGVSKGGYALEVEEPTDEGEADERY